MIVPKIVVNLSYVKAIDTTTEDLVFLGQVGSIPSEGQAIIVSGIFYTVKSNTDVVHHFGNKDGDPEITIRLTPIYI